MTSPSLPLGGRVRIVKDGASPLYAIQCATPCGGERGCTQMQDAQMRPASHPSYSGGICWLGSALHKQRAKAYAESIGYVVVEDEK